jgi:hypothetical protein
MWLGRPRGAEGVRRIVKLLAERFGVVGRLVSDQTCKASDLDGVKLLIVPTCESIDTETESAIQSVRDSGGLVLVLGPIEGDFAGRPLNKLNRLLGQRSLALREITSWGWATFDQTLSQSLRAGASNFDPDASRGSNLWHEGLPLDYAREEEPLAGILSLALKTAGIEAGYQAHPTVSGVLKNNGTQLAGMVNESSLEAQREFVGVNYRVDLKALPGRSSLCLIDAITGKILVSYQPPEFD